ncbi:MAG: PQQ-binding-like beta-propeller repeat protein, partial [Fluviibacter sp.]
MIAYFGSFGVLAYDWNGKELWKKPLPAPIVEFGTSSSPIIADGKVILVVDQDVGSYMIALDVKTGAEVWRVDRREFRRGFSTPFIWKHGGVEELIVSGSLWTRSYDLKDGIAISNMLKASGLVDFLNVTRGHIDTDPGLTDNIPIMGMASAPHLQTAGEVRAATKFPIFHATRIQDVATARFAIQSGK